MASPNTNAGTAVINVNAGNTLTVNGNVTLGANTAATDVTKVNFTGGGDLVQNGTSFQVGGGVGGTNVNGATVDMTALGSLTANLGATGTFRVGDVTTGTNAASSILLLPAVSTITANVVGVGDQTAGNVTQTLRLGSGLTTINANTLSIGANGSSARANGVLVFNGAAGTLKVRSQADPVNGRANLNVANMTFATANTATGSFDTTGHSADLLLNAVVLGGRTGANTGGATATFAFDTGTLDVNSLVAGTKTVTTTGGTVAGTAMIGGGASVFNNTTGPIQLGLNASNNGAANGTLTINGGTVTIAANGGVSIALGTASVASGSASGTLNIFGGVTTLAGDLIKGTSLGTSTAVLNITGTGTLDMGGKKIGGSAAGNNLTSLTFASGTLMNVGEINNGAPFNKTTAGTLILEGTNTYSGTTTISEGTLQVGTGGATGTLGTSTAPIANSGTLEFNRSNTLAVPNVISGTGAVTQTGSGTTQLTAVNTYTGVTTITGGVLQVSTLADGGADSGIGASSSSAANLILNGGALGYVGTGIGTGITNRSFSLGLGASAGGFDASGAAGSPMVLSSTLAPTLVGSGSRTLTLTGSNTDANTLAAPLADNGGATSVVKNGAGTWVLTGSSTHTGSTVVNGGVLQVGAGGTGSITGPVTVNSPGTLSGSGSVGSTIIGPGASLAPGDGNPASSNTTLTFTAVTLQSGSSTTLTIGSAQAASSGDLSTILGALANNSYDGTAGKGIVDIIGAGNLAAYNSGTGGANHDLLNVTGSFNVTAGSTITIANNGYLAGTPAIGDIFNLVDWSSVSAGTFDSGTNFRSGGLVGAGDLVLPDLSSFSLGWDVSAFLTHGIVVVVPEPSRALLLLFGLLGLCYRRRRAC
ncbi:MAG: beta strand repeat-containing protein [Prosthecobacter sp.]